MFAMMGGWTKLSVGSMLAMSSVLAHVVAPWAMLAAWLFTARHGGLRWRDAAAFMLFPLAYLLQMFVRVSLGDDYPYPEFDASRVGTGSALAFAGAAVLLFLVLGLLLVSVDRLLARRRRASDRSDAR